MDEAISAALIALSMLVVIVFTGSGLIYYTTTIEKELSHRKLDIIEKALDKFQDDNVPSIVEILNKWYDKKD